MINYLILSQCGGFLHGFCYTFVGSCLPILTGFRLTFGIYVATIILVFYLEHKLYYALH
ncbi:hypothetical protein F4815DRAFT_341651 [Daldinia loculata]|nr:hypothetical protein F4815DRAFT_341651 [Daldinia loculata]